MILSAPQTPLLKSKLSLDIPPNYSGVNTPSSVRSPSLSPLPSPTLSGSWNVNKTQAELTVFLKDAYRMIREKERDLTLAAEIGKNLLENNVALKTKCEALVAQLQKLQRQNQKASAFTIKAHATEKPSAVPIAPPSSSLDPFGDESCDYEESDSESISGWSSSHEMSPSISAMKRSNSKRVNHQNQQSSLTFKELEIIKDLELRNQDLQARLDEVIKEYNETDKIDKTKIRVLESELERSQEIYTQATERIEVLEEDKKLLSQKQSTDFWQNKYSKKSLENDEIIENLMNKVTELEQQNIQIERQKAETEKKLHKVTSELDALREHCDQLIDESRDYGMLQVEAKQKQELIDELSESLEYERSKIVSLRSSGMYSRPSSRSNSFSENTYNTLRRLSNPDRSLFGAAPQTPTTGPTHSSGGLGGLGVKIKRTLLSELENEWYRELTFQQKSIENDDDEPPSFSEKDLSEFFINNGARSDLFDDDDDISRLDYLSDSEFSFFDEFDTDNEKAVRIREWFWKRWVKSVYAFFRLIWRWVKFILILFAANIMALYRGPDDILPEDVYN